MGMFKDAKEAKEHKTAPPTSGIPKWQYKKVQCGSIAGDNMLNQEGEQGWEVCGIIEEKMGTQAIMKRQCGVVTA